MLQQNLMLFSSVVLTLNLMISENTFFTVVVFTKLSYRI